ncbi:PP2C family serine/threonine-protein phosphatase [Massilia sp. S19_KUP03_FR1]|uniref:PP2C family serine/threonine-protein phosphatase n=1 Tax=Massilia sp. S19_KUP03_FR1 TaxID=3025503 RepID=UPI002FCD3490
MDIDENLRAYARRHLLGTSAAADRAQLEDFLHSAPFRALIGVFHARLEKTMHDFTTPPDPTPMPQAAAAEPIPLPLKDLSQPDEADAPVPAITPAPAPALLLRDIGFRLPNARAGDAYRQPLEAVPPSEDKVIFLPLAPDTGLTVEPASGIVSGTPQTPGEVLLGVTYHYASEPGQLRVANVKLTVNPDPKKMWQNLPPPVDAPYPRTDTDCAALTDEHFRILAASKRGRSHAHVGSFRDDDFRIAQLAGSGWQIAVLADGAGSAKYSRQGAAIICEQATARLTAALSGERGAMLDEAVASYDQDRSEEAALALRTVLSGVVGNAAYYAAKGIMDECAAVKDTLQAVPRDYASTALIAICKRYPFGILSAAYWVGDGAVGVYSVEDGITLLGDVDSGEFSGQTRFLEAAEVAQEALLRRTRFVLSNNMTALVLMTDGVSDPRFETEARLARPADWHALWSELAETLHLADTVPGKEQGLLDWLDFWSPGNHDDRTIALITPRISPAQGPHD